MVKHQLSEEFTEEQNESLTEAKDDENPFAEYIKQPQNEESEERESTLQPEKEKKGKFSLGKRFN
jgi:hypothetical protein